MERVYVQIVGQVSKLSVSLKKNTGQVHATQGDEAVNPDPEKLLELHHNTAKAM